MNLSLVSLFPILPVKFTSTRSLQLPLSCLSLLVVMLLTIGEGRAQTANITQGCVPMEVQFTPPAGSGTHFWVFGDGATSQLASPANTFITAGTYTVQYSSSQGGPVVGTITINVYNKPVPTFTADPMSGCSPLSVQFTNTTTLSPGITITGYSWVFGDGGLASGANPNRVFSQAGSHFVSLGLTTNLVTCNVTQVYPDQIVVSQSPSTVFTTTPSPATACVPPLQVTFNNSSASGSGITYNWNFGNGSTSTQQFPPPQTYTENGNFTITLQVTNEAGCTGQMTRQVSIGQPTTAFTVPPEVCPGDTVQLLNTSSAGNYQWTLSSGVVFRPQSTATTPNPWVIFYGTGQQTITLQTTSANGQCTSQLTQNVLIQNPSAQFTSTPSYSCSLPLTIQYTPLNTGYASYDWLFIEDSTTSTLVSPSHTYPLADTTYSWFRLNWLPTTLIVTTNIGCRDTVTLNDSIHLPNAVFFPNISNGCAPLTVMFSDSSTSNENIVQWKWHMGDGTIITSNTNAPQSVTYTQPGHYASYLVITNAAGCTDTSYRVITQVGTQLSPQFTVDETVLCPGGTVQFSNQTALADSVDAWHFYAEGYHQFHCWDNPEPSWTFNSITGPLDVTLMVEFNGCYSSSTQNGLITVNGPIADIFFTTYCEDPYTVEFENHSQDFTDILWDFGDGTTSTEQNPTHTYADRGDYPVTLTVTNSGSGCPVDVDNVLMRIREIRAQFTSDTLLCGNVGQPFDASLSQDVYSECWGGYTWRFDHPGMRPITTTSPDFPINFPFPGDVEVTLIVKDLNDCRDTARVNVRVFTLDAAFNPSDVTVCPAQQLTMNNASTSDTTIVSHQWSLGLGQNSTAVSPQFTYGTFSSDTITVQLITTNAIGCVDTANAYLTMYQPVSSIATNPGFPNVCAGGTVGFTATQFTGGGSSLTYTWNFQDGTPTATGQNVSHVFDQAGIYNVSVNFQEVGTGCGGTATRTVNVQAYPEAGFSHDADASGIVCRPQNVIFTNTSTSATPVSILWNLGNGSTGSTNPFGTVYSESGTYTATITVTTSFGCSSTYSEVFQVVGPQGSFVTDIDVLCRGEEVTFTIQDTAEVYNYVWDFGDGNTVSNQSPVSHTYTFVPPGGQTIAKLIVSSVNGACPVQSEQPIFIHEVVAAFIRNNGGDTAICFQPYGFTNQSLNSDSYFWQFGDGTTFTGANPPVHVYPEPGTYTVSLGVANAQLGCNDTMIRQVILHPLPEVTAIGDTICEGDMADLRITDIISGADYLWSGPSAVGNPAQPNTTTQPVLTGLFTVGVTDSNGCTDTDEATVVVINPPVISDWDTSIVIGDIINLPFNADPNFYIISWTPSEGLSCDDCPLPSLQPLVDVEYQLQVSDILGCFTSEATFKVEIKPETFIKLPTTFSPNGDGVNDVIYVEGWGIKELMEFQIFNRWGEMMFESNDKAIGWDGYYKGTLQNNDVYAFKVRALTWRDETQTLEGYINLMR
jgi:gliding motility-associated-like protein